MKRTIIAFSMLILVAMPAKADLLCPEGSLNDFNDLQLWGKFAAKNPEYVSQLLSRLSYLLKDVLDARNLDGQLKAATILGRQNAVVMERMFEQGLFAATDIVFAYCYKVPDGEPWTKAIKEERRKAWCNKESRAYFCPR